jgi:hypothetical protein
VKLQPLAAAASVTLGVVAGVLVNLATSRWTWAVGSALAIVAVAWAALAYVAAQSGSRSPAGSTGRGAAHHRVRQTARRGMISGSKIRLRGAGSVSERATGSSQITDSSITARDADVARKASRGGRIDRSDIDAG